MDIFIYTIPLTILIAMIGLFFLIWAIKTGQYEDELKHGGKILMIDETSDRHEK